MCKKLIALCLVMVFVLLAGCGNTDDTPSAPQKPQVQSQNEATKEIQLLYCANDTMNPYKTISKLNAELTYLIFEPLVMVDNNFEAVLSLAKSVETQNNLCTVQIRQTVFSDGSEVTADDVVFSYNLAKESDRYSSLFYNVEGVSASDLKTVVFTLKENDPYFAKLLTFPILKTDSDQLKNEDNVELVPIGSGKFVFSKDGDSLVPNPKHYDASLKISKIKLINAPDSESMQHYVEIGATDIYYAQMWDDTIIRMSGKKTDVNLNNLIYLGINHNYAPLKSADIRYAISSAVSRSTLATRAFYTNAVPATGFFHPDWKEVSDFQTIQPTADLKISVENLANIGYNRLNEDGYYENMHGNILEFTLLVNSDSATKLAAAQLIADQLKSAGIKITLVPLSKDAYFSALKAGQFQLYLGEIKLLPNMDMRSLVAAGGKAAYGIVNATQPIVTEDQTENTTAEEYFDSETSYAQVVKGFYKGENTIADVASSLLASMPVIPLLYRSSILFYAGDIEDVASPSCYDIFFSIDNYKFKQ